MSSNATSTLSWDELKVICGDPGLVATRVADLLASLASDDDEYAALVVDTLREYKDRGLPPAGDIAALCEHAHPAVAGWSCKLLAAAGELNDAEQAPIVHTLAAHPETSARQDAALALSGVATLSATARETLTIAAQSDDPRLSRLAQTCLKS